MHTKQLLEMIDVAKPLVMKAMEIYGRIEEPEGVGKNGALFEDILLYMPREWRNRSFDPLVKNTFGAEMVQATFSAISELVVERKLHFGPHLVTTRSVPLGHWELGIFLV